ncbi:hypothetical protein ACC703_05755 [Rhizobium ruizarguesonis]
MKAEASAERVALRTLDQPRQDRGSRQRRIFEEKADYANCDVNGKMKRGVYRFIEIRSGEPF